MFETSFIELDKNALKANLGFIRIHRAEIDVCSQRKCLWTWD